MQKRTKSLRVASGAKPGGQSGHPGSTLKKSIRIDHVITHPLPEHCSVCGDTLADAMVTEGGETRQVIDLPAIRFNVTEHRTVHAQCRCGAKQSSHFPSELVSAVQYGLGVRAAAVYLSIYLSIYLTQYQQIPFQRCAQALRDLFGLPLSAGSIVNYVAQAANLLAPQVAAIADALVTQAVVHFDETGLRYDNTLGWMHSASTAEMTFYAVHAKRGSVAMDDVNVLPRFGGIAE